MAVLKQAHDPEMGGRIADLPAKGGHSMSPECERWAELADLEALGEPLPDGGLTFRNDHEASCRYCAHEAAVWRAAKVPQTPHAVDPADVQKILFLAAARSRRTALSARWKGALVVGGGVTALAAAILLWFSVRGAPAGLPNGRALETPVVATLKQPPPTPTPTERHVDEGAEPYCSQAIPGATVCFGRGALLARRALTGPHRELELARGRAVVSLAPQAPGTSFSLTSAAGKVTAVGTIFSLDVSGDGTAIARVVEGKVLVSAANGGTAYPVHAGQAFQLGAAQPKPLSNEDRDLDLALLSVGDDRERGAALAPGAPKPPVRSVPQAPPRDLLEYARSLRANGDFRRAAEVYRKVHADSPQSPSGRAALVSLGDLLLTLGDASGALSAFDSYLVGGGTLAQEASFGRVRALRALGRSGDEQRAIQRFVAAYPGSPQSRVLRARLAAMQK